MCFAGAVARRGGGVERVLCAGGVSSGIYPTDSASQVEYLINDSRTKVIFAEDDEQLDKILACRARCLGAFAAADSMAGACATHCTEPLAVALTCPADPLRKPAEREPLFHAGCGRGAQKVGGRPCRTSTSRPSLTVWASRCRS